MKDHQLAARVADLEAQVVQVAKERDDLGRLALHALDRWSHATQTPYEALIESCEPNVLAAWNALLLYAHDQGWITAEAASDEKRAGMN